MQDLESSTKIKEVKSRMTGFCKSEDHIVLYYEQKKLKDRRTLGYYHIKNQSVIKVECKN